MCFLAESVTAEIAADEIKCNTLLICLYKICKCCSVVILGPSVSITCKGMSEVKHVFEIKLTHKPFLN